MSKRNWFAIIALGRDRPGIVADLSGCIFECGYNLEDASMTQLGNEFAVLMLASALDPGDGSARQTLLDATKRLEWERNLTVFVRPLEEAPPPRTSSTTARYTVTAVGVDRAGIVAGVSRCLAEYGCGIADLRGVVSEAPQSGTPVYTLRIRTSVPDEVNTGSLARRLEQIGKEVDVEISFSEDTAD